MSRRSRFGPVEDHEKHAPSKPACPKGHPYTDDNMCWTRKSDGTPYYKCAACMRQRWLENKERYRHKEPDQSARIKALRERNPEQEMARRKVNTALRSGKLKKAKYCAHCGKTDCRIEASHDDYSMPLVVEWLCVMCHRRKDRKFKLPEELEFLGVSSQPADGER